MLRVDVVSAEGEIFEELVERLMSIEPLGREHRLTQSSACQRIAQMFALLKNPKIEPQILRLCGYLQL